LRAARSIFVVSEESRDRAIALGARPDRTVVVGNTPDDVESLIGHHPFPADLRPLADRPRVVFVGTLIADRGVTESVEAFPLVLREIPDAALVIVGDGPDRARLARTVERLRLGDHVMLLGWREHNTLAGFYQHCQVGLLPFLDTPHVRVTMANKLFDYMAGGLPVLGSDLPPIRRVLAETGAGVLFPPGDREAFAERLVRLLRDADYRRTLGANGRKAVTEKYRWTSDAAVFLDRINEFGISAGVPPEPPQLIGARP